jgi:hypothetical protein
MPSAAFLRAFEAANVQPVVLMRLESASALRRTVTTQADWQACQMLTGWDATALPGAVVPAKTGYVMAATVEPARQALSVSAISGQIHIRKVNTSPQIYAGNYQLALTLRRNGVEVGSYSGTLAYPYHSWTIDTVLPIQFVLPAPVAFSLGDQIDASVVANSIMSNGPVPTSTTWATPPTLETRTASGSLRTAVLDLGLTPAAAVVFTADDNTPPGASLVYRAFGSASAGGPWDDFGAVTDGASLSARRYYYIEADHAWSARDYPEVREIRLTGSDGQFLDYSTHADQPTAGAKPYLTEQPLSALSSKIALMDKPTTGEVTVRMVWNDHTSAMLAGGTLKNKTVSLHLGAVGLSAAEFEPLFTGVWHDYTIDWVKGQLSITVRDALKLFAKAKVPRETRRDGVSLTAPLVFAGANVTAAIIAIADAQLVPGRFIDEAALNALAAPGGPCETITVTRTISEPVEADKLLAELATTAGIFLVPQPSGALSPVRYDPDAEPVAYLDARSVELGSISGGQKDLYTRQILYYQPIGTDPGEQAEDYARGLVWINQAAEEATGETSEKRWYDKWSAPAAAIEALAARMDAWYANPHMTLTVSKLPLRYLGIRPGQVVAVDNLPLPSASWPGLSAGRKFLVLGRDLDPNSLTIKLSLYDLQTTGSPGSGVIGSTLAISGPLQPFGAGNSYTATGGSGSYTWEATAGSLNTTSGATVLLDVSGLAGPATLKVTSGAFAATLRLDILPPQVSGVGYRHTDLGTVLYWSPASAMVKEYQVRRAGEILATLRSTEFPVGLLPAGVTSFSLHAIAQWDNLSGVPATVAITVQPPGMLSLRAVVIDNNVNLYFTGIPASYPIASYRCFKGDTWADAVFLAEGDATFQAIFEREAGLYTYWIEPRDNAGNYGTPMSVTAQVNEPPDYVLFSDQDLDLSAATLSSALLEQGSLLLPVNTTETWTEHFTNNAWASPQAQIDAGYPLYLQPTPASGYLEEEIDFGGIIPGTLLTLTATWQPLAGGVTMTPKLETSADSISWTDHGAVWEARAEGCRYVRVRITATGADNHALAVITRVNLRLDVKEKDDAGSGTAVSTDATGTWVSFNKSFVDITSLDVTAAYQSGIDGIIAQPDFADAPNPTGFSVYLFRRSDGTRLSGAFSWKVKGV